MRKRYPPKESLTETYLLLIVAIIAAIIFATGCAPAQGPAGPKGDKGDPGDSIQGPPGLSCTVTAVTNGSIISCEDGTQTTITNGLNGGSITTVALCPSNTGGVFNEYLLLIANEPYAVYVRGQAIGITKLWPGTWETTDGRKCQFTINPDLSISY